jgi:alpha-L-rhamnosidase
LTSGIHFERTQTWWELSRAWITYLSRCQFLLQQGLSVADLCYLAPEASPQVFRPFGKSEDSRMMELAGYKLDGCTPEALLSRMSVRDGFLILPDGMSYRALVLPRVPSMTPRLLRKIQVLVQGGCDGDRVKAGAISRPHGLSELRCASEAAG